jgi:hypothetical protein
MKARDIPGLFSLLAVGKVVLNGGDDNGQAAY